MYDMCLCNSAHESVCVYVRVYPHVRFAVYGNVSV